MQIAPPDLSDFTISYAGHGMIEQATKTNSIAHVVAHENRHLDHFENYARFHGKEIIHENISIRYEFVEGKIVAVAGEATATIRDKPVENKNHLNEVSSEASATTDVPTISRDSAREAKINALLGRLETALQRVEAELDSSAKNSARTGNRDSDRLASIRARKLQLEAKKKEIQKMRVEMTAEKMQEALKEILGGAAALLSDSAGFVRAIYGLKSGKQISENPDNHNEVSLPDYSLSYTGTLLDTMV